MTVHQCPARRHSRGGLCSLFSVTNERHPVPRSLVSVLCSRPLLSVLCSLLSVSFIRSIHGKTVDLTTNANAEGFTGPSALWSLLSLSQSINNH